MLYDCLVSCTQSSLIIHYKLKIVFDLSFLLSAALNSNLDPPTTPAQVIFSISSCFALENIITNNHCYIHNRSVFMYTVVLQYLAQAHSRMHFNKIALTLF